MYQAIRCVVRCNPSRAPHPAALRASWMYKHSEADSAAICTPSFALVFAVGSGNAVDRANFNCSEAAIAGQPGAVAEWPWLWEALAGRAGRAQAGGP